MTRLAPPCNETLALIYKLLCEWMTRLQLKVWNVSTGKCSLTLRGHTKAVRSVVVMPDGRWVVVGYPEVGVTIRISSFGTSH